MSVFREGEGERSLALLMFNWIYTVNFIGSINQDSSIGFKNNETADPPISKFDIPKKGI